MSAQIPLPFRDRQTAGRLLAHRLEHLRAEHPIILALPRGGVPIGFEIARALDAQLELLMVRKLGAPGHSEYAIGAVVDGDEPQMILNEEAVRIIRPGREYLQAELGRQLVEMERRRRAYIGSRKMPSLAGRTIIIVDDGIATGSTITAALQGARRRSPARLVLAVPVAPADVVRRLESLCDEIVVLATPEPFFAVGRHYRHFDQVSDDQVVQLLNAATLDGQGRES
ncbi:phosphoribosyltransferase [Croceicoccus mobilis]|uniref:Phosphoribosyltransferase n=1 Tax=Croceicoccus mobilis TaxID=1703339 RepID=A0A916Z4T8_9SPHN|nr:phosphoribosyltransferase [Croceicoccus mobilis]GGD75804.1 phosphoribosyltransferase [Croceicoccus mobilis]